MACFVVLLSVFLIVALAVVVKSVLDSGPVFDVVALVVGIDVSPVSLELVDVGSVGLDSVLFLQDASGRLMITRIINVKKNRTYKKFFFMIFSPFNHEVFMIK